MKQAGAMLTAVFLKFKVTADSGCKGHIRRLSVFCAYGTTKDYRLVLTYEASVKEQQTPRCSPPHPSINFSAFRKKATSWLTEQQRCDCDIILLSHLPPVIKTNQRPTYLLWRPCCAFRLPQVHVGATFPLRSPEC